MIFLHAAKQPALGFPWKVRGIVQDDGVGRLEPVRWQVYGSLFGWAARWTVSGGPCGLTGRPRVSRAVRGSIWNLEGSLTGRDRGSASLDQGHTVRLSPVYKGKSAVSGNKSKRATMVFHVRNPIVPLWAPVITPAPPARVLRTA